MPPDARANGMWHGPDPAALQDLTYTENKVINLARIYVSVKRIFLDRRSFAGTSDAEAPRCHNKNVVAYPQSPDAALTALGCSPKALSQTMVVQFVGNNPEALRTHPDLQVSVPRLRGAFQWLSENCWVFMEATRDNSMWEQGALRHSLEPLLSMYSASICGLQGVT